MTIELDWHDIKDIVELADSILDSTDKKELLTFGKIGFYSKVLSVFEGMRNTGTAMEE